MSFLPLVRIWLLLSALASVAGWLLSAVGQLNRPGYAAVAGLGLLGLFLTRREWLRDGHAFSWPRVQARFARPLPLALAALAALVLLGGILYAPGNYDALTYRLPRVLHWLAQGRWHWIHTTNYRMNNRSCGFEWLMTPVFLATRSDRALFLINFLPFLLLPGLVFSVFTRLGVNARVAWQWMWLLPTGYNFLLQAASLGNDAFAAAYALAAVDFALRAASSRRIADVWFSLLAAALLTGAKSGNLPLLLPWAMLFIPVAPRLLSRMVPSLLVILAAAMASCLPTALLNSLNCADWTGLSLERPEVAMHHPLVGILGNSIMFGLSNFTPTLFPLAGWWVNAAPALLPGFKLFAAHFEGNFYRLGEIPTEEWSGLGFGLSCLLAAGVGLALFSRRSQAAPVSKPAGPADPLSPTPWFRLAGPSKILLASPYVSLLFFFAKSGMMTIGRLVSAYYPLLLPLLISHPSASALVRHRWWRRATGVVLWLALVAVVLTPARPLWPVQNVLAHANDASSSPSFLHRVKNVYQVYADRPDPFAALRAALPDNAVVGFVADSNDPEVSLWRPYGHRRVVDLLPSDTPAWIQSQGIEYAVVGEMYLFLHHQTLATWLPPHHATVIASTTVTLTVADGLHHWYVVQFAPVGNASPQTTGVTPQ